MLKDSIRINVIISSCHGQHCTCTDAGLTVWILVAVDQASWVSRSSQGMSMSSGASWATARLTTWHVPWPQAYASPKLNFTLQLGPLHIEAATSAPGPAL